MQTNLIQPTGFGGVARGCGMLSEGILSLRMLHDLVGLWVCLYTCMEEVPDLGGIGTRPAKLDWKQKKGSFPGSVPDKIEAISTFQLTTVMLFHNTTLKYLYLCY